MSITFTAEHAAPVGYVIACCEAAAYQRPRCGTYDEAVDALRDFELCHMVNGDDLRPSLPGCDLPDICPEYPWHVLPIYGDPAPAVEVGHGQAADVLRTLGYADAAGLVDLAGCAEPGDFEGRSLLALALVPADEGVPSHDDTRVGGPRWFEGGRRAGYMPEKLAALAELARWCGERGRRVTWA